VNELTGAITKTLRYLKKRKDIKLNAQKELDEQFRRLGIETY